jgi:hypothetical protein
MTNPQDRSDTDDKFAALTWLEADQTPLGLRVLDCRSVAFGMTSTTGDESVARRYLELRDSSGDEHVGRPPDDPLVAEADLCYGHDGSEIPDGRLFSSECMEDKWDAFLLQGFLYFRRSWTGNLIYKARMAIEPDAVRLTDIVANTANCDGNPRLAVWQLDYLIRSHIFGRPVAHPVPDTIPPQPDEIALYSFSQYGRRGMFASYEDTTQGRPWFFGDEDAEKP